MYLSKRPLEAAALVFALVPVLSLQTGCAALPFASSAQDAQATHAASLAPQRAEPAPDRYGRGAPDTQASEDRRSASSPGPVPAEKAGWKLHFRDDFDRDELGDSWLGLEGSWSVEDGAIEGRGILLSAKGFPDDSWGFTRIECEFETSADPSQLASDAEASALGCMIHVRPPERTEGEAWENGYSFQFSGVGEALSRILRDGVEIAVGEDSGAPIVPGRIHRVVVENEEGRLRCFVDGQLILEAKDKSPFFAGDDYNRVGFRFPAKARLHSVKVYIKRLDGMDHFLF